MHLVSNQTFSSSFIAHNFYTQNRTLTGLRRRSRKQGKEPRRWSVRVSGLDRVLVRDPCLNRKLKGIGVCCWGFLVERKIVEVCLCVVYEMRESGERWGIYTKGCFGLGLGFRPKPVTAQRPTRNRPVASHGHKSLETSWSRVGFLVLGLGSRLTYNTYIYTYQCTHNKAHIT